MKHKLSRRAFAAGAVLTATGATRLAAQGAPEWWDKITPYQTIGPFYPANRPHEADADMTRLHGHANRAKGQVIEVFGRVLDRFGKPISNAKIELWQANMHGQYSHGNAPHKEEWHDPDFQGFAEIRTDPDGNWRVTTIKPGAYAGRTNHIHFDVVGREQRLITQMYFPDEEANNAEDGLLRRAGDGAPLLIAHKTADHAYHWDIRLADT
ncbi:protocatechuate 3,4-dioxygenase subunit beta [Erythrobacter sp. Dej080120_24]|uniref:dioxygenase family protein n=1 Tax=Erythrobacter TaxID=1041 RepID=UPI0004D40FC9|nr:protocatechuate 3,4-dioxygenase [Erythrobacter aurantius]KEO86328.1 hypothetical protein EH30_10830 [Erythrobacter sp. JL475]BDW83547.1 protocatechuate 3,4-dioxygenase subunit beta [Erythrobacter sp. Dej080120_24]